MLENPEIRNVCALQLRQTTSSLVYGIIILPTIDGLAFTSKLVSSHPELLLYLAIAGLFATVSYLFYYKAIAGVGVSKAMALNVTYCAWAMICSVLVLQDVSVVTPLTVMCSLIVLICGVLAATDFKALLKSKNN